jgi:hypothetical protein
MCQSDDHRALYEIPCSAGIVTRFPAFGTGSSARRSEQNRHAAEREHLDDGAWSHGLNETAWREVGLLGQALGRVLPRSLPAQPAR